jgi:hypothetical protein
VAIWYIFPRFGILCQEKAGNPVRDERKDFDFFLGNHFRSSTPNPGTDVMIFKIQLVFAKKLNRHIGFEKSANFSPKVDKNRRKL